MLKEFQKTALAYKTLQEIAILKCPKADIKREEKTWYFFKIGRSVDDIASMILKNYF